MRSMTFLIVHYTVHIPRWGKFITGGVITDRRKLLSLVSQQSTIFFHCTVYITIMATTPPPGLKYIYIYICMVNWTFVLYVHCQMQIIFSKNLVHPLKKIISFIIKYAVRLKDFTSVNMNTVFSDVTACNLTQKLMF